MDVQVFKTSIIQPRQLKQLRQGLTAIGRWNVDLDDCDHILRVETCACAIPRIISLLALHGFSCEELPD